MSDSIVTEMGYFGNIWVRMHSYPKAGDIHKGHKHNFDHVTLVTSGKVLCEVEGHEPKEFTAPTFIVISKDKLHNFTAMEDNTTYFCIFAMRDLDGNVMDAYGPGNSPYAHDGLTDDKLEAILAPTCISCNGCSVATALKNKYD
jgi:hypothetical protein